MSIQKGPWVWIVAGWLATAEVLWAGMLTGGGDTLLKSPSLDPWTVGVFFQQVERGVELDNGDVAPLEARTYGALLGYDLASWLTLYGTAGTTEARTDDFFDYEKGRFSWSAGMNVHWWQWSGYSERPVWRINFKTRAEASGYESGSEDYKIEWNEYQLSFPIGYEVIFARQDDSFSDIHHLELFVGPALSWVDGSFRLGGGKTDFVEDQLLGVVGGATLYVTKSLFVSGQAHYFDDFTGTLGVGYSFQ